MAPRRTKPIATQVIPPFSPSNARFQARLIDFDTDSPVLTSQHEAFLRNTMGAARLNSSFHLRLFGFASKLGSATHNDALAHDRMNAVVNFLQKIDQRTLSNIEAFQNFGESLSRGGERDDSPEFRAVELHLFIGPIPPPPPPPNNKPVVIEPVPLPGGPRFKEWSIAAPGGVTIAEGIGFGFNMFMIENRKLAEKRGYFQAAAGVGASLSLSGLKGAAQVIQQILTDRKSVV